MDESRELAKFVAKLKYGDLPKNVVKKTKDLILDQLGVELASSNVPWSKSRLAISVIGLPRSAIV